MKGEYKISAVAIDETGKETEWSNTAKKIKVLLTLDIGETKEYYEGILTR